MLLIGCELTTMALTWYCTVCNHAEAEKYIVPGPACSAMMSYVIGRVPPTALIIPLNRKFEQYMASLPPPPPPPAMSPPE